MDDPSNSSGEVSIEKPKDCVLTATIAKIKTEHISQSSIHRNVEIDSDVMILSAQAQSIILLSDDEDGNTTFNMLVNDDAANDLDRDRYQMQLDRDSQNVESAVRKSPQEKSPVLSENNSLQESYDLRVRQLEMNDKQRAGGSNKRKNVEVQISHPLKRSKQKATVPITFVDSENQPSIDQHGRQLTNTFANLNDENFTSSSAVVTRKTFTFNSHTPHPHLDNGSSCFIIELQRATYKRDYIFEISIHLPQFLLYDVLVKNENIQYTLSLNDLEWQTLTNNLYTIGEYEYLRGLSNSNKSSNCGHNASLVRQLDLYFSTISQIKPFQIISNGHDFTSSIASAVPSNLQTLIIDSDVLSSMCKENLS